MPDEIRVKLRKAGEGLGFNVFRVSVPELPLVVVRGEKPYFDKPSVGAVLYCTKATTLSDARAEVQALGMGLVVRNPAARYNAIRTHRVAMAA
jgi:hypothetical protein